jgi:hypothetical protein
MKGSLRCREVDARPDELALIDVGCVKAAIHVVELVEGLAWLLFL